MNLQVLIANLFILSLNLLVFPSLSDAQQQPQQQQVIPRQLARNWQALGRHSGGQPAESEYLIGFGISEIVGPSADVNVFGVFKLVAKVLVNLLSSSLSQSRSDESSPGTLGNKFKTKLTTLFGPQKEQATVGKVLSSEQALSRQVVGKKPRIGRERPAGAWARSWSGGRARSAGLQTLKGLRSIGKLAKVDEVHEGLAAVSVGGEKIMGFQYPSLRDLESSKLNVKLNLRSIWPTLLTGPGGVATGMPQSIQEEIIRWFKPSQLKFQLDSPMAKFIVRI